LFAFARSARGERANKHKGERTADFSRSHSRSNGFSSRMPRETLVLLEWLGVCASDLKQQFISVPFNPEAFI
jgi:hypothetical protein